MADLAASPLELACERRFSAWTLYARAFSGNRVDADYIVQKAVSAALRLPRALATEAEAHGHVLSSIRTSALRSLQSSRAAAPAASVLEFLRLPGNDALETSRAAATAMRRLRHLPRTYRRTIERVVLHRPPSTLDRVASSEGVSSAAVTATIESGLRNVAAGVRWRSGARAEPPESRAAVGTAHPELEALVTYVHGALSGDEARAIAAHGYACAACGDRLGTMMLLKAACAEAFRLPRVPRSYRRAGAGLALIAALSGGVLLVRDMMPNPWAEHATHENVPRWFHDFFYRPDDPRATSELARGLALLVDGKYDDAIEKLEPLVEDRHEDAEAASYLGIARYLNGDTSRSTVRLLEAGTSSSRSGRLARWYLASVLLSRGDVDRATTQLRALTTTRDWFGRAAESLLEKLEAAKQPESSVEAD